MAFSKTLLLLGLAFLVVSSIASARELAETTQENSQVDLDHYPGERAGPGVYGHGGRCGKEPGKTCGKGKGHGKEHGGHRKHPPSETEEGN